ncbi:MAG: PQQ-dependent sugar dehydrogenase [Alphaproteobacteria bacterium]
MLKFLAKVQLGLLALGLAACTGEGVANQREVVNAPADGYKIDTMAEGLSHPWSIAFLPDGDFLVTEKSGTLRRLAADGTLSDPIMGVPDVYFASQGGLFDVMLDKAFAANQTLYLSYAAGPANENATTVLRARLVEGALEDQQVIFEVTRRKATALHYGGRLAQLADGSILLSVGEGSRYKEEAQDPTNHLGTIVRINPDGSVPADNPFVGRDGFLPEIYSYGHRNPQGLVVDPKTNTIWEHEHGARGGDELNLVKPGENYGWPIATTGVDYTFAQITPYRTYPGMVDPVLDWVPSIAPSGLVLYQGQMFPQWRGKFLVGGLASYDVRLLTMEDGKITKEEILFAEVDERIRDLREGPDGALYILTDGEGGSVLRVTAE